jgi:predicted porin
MGDTEDARLDDSVKYFLKTDLMRAGALYQFGKSDSSPGEAWQGNVGLDYAGFSVDAIFGHKNDAIAASSLTVAQAATAPANSLAATISDNTSYTLAASYAAGPLKAFVGYERMKFENPSSPLTAGTSGLGGYLLGIVNNSAFPHPRILEASWGGVRYLVAPDFDITGAFYHYDQNSYGAVHCSTTAAATCSGTLDAYSAMADYRMTRRLDIYGGVMFSKVADGLASGFLHTSNASPMAGFRYRF